jgi:cell division protein FtsI (penicillin-binding protein 3)
MSEAQRSGETILYAKRGRILDRNGNVLAETTDAMTIYAVPQEIKDPQATARVLADVLGGEYDDYYAKLSEAKLNKDTTFVYILQKADVALAEALQARGHEYKERHMPFVHVFQNAELALDEALQACDQGLEGQSATETRAQGFPDETSRAALHGIYYLKDTRRVYPHGAIGAQIIGMVGTDNTGLFGLEYMYDAVLRGTNGKLATEYSLQKENRPASGQPIPGSARERVEPIDGKDIVVSLDIELQQYVESELVRVGTEREAEGGNVLVLEGATGEITAAASLPLADRDNMDEEMIASGATTLKAICWGYEPGSIFKPLTAAAILEEGAMGIEDGLFAPAYRSIDGYTISDSHPRPDKDMSFRTIIAESSNVGISLAKERISDETYASYLKRFGIGQPTHVDFSGEETGILAPWETWSAVQSANISFGQGVTVSSLQVASFYGAVANDGIKYQPHFLVEQPQVLTQLNIADKSERIMPSATARTLEDMLISVVTDGTGKTAGIEGYVVAGKTGTAEKAAPNPADGYLRNSYIVSFVGYLAESPNKLVCITSMDNPIGADGNAPTGPLFASIMQFAANRYMIEPQGQSDSGG